MRPCANQEAHARLPVATEEVTRLACACGVFFVGLTLAQYLRVPASNNLLELSSSPVAFGPPALEAKEHAECDRYKDATKKKSSCRSCNDSARDQSESNAEIKCPRGTFNKTTGFRLCPEQHGGA